MSTTTSVVGASAEAPLTLSQPAALDVIDALPWAAGVASLLTVAVALPGALRTRRSAVGHG